MPAIKDIQWNYTTSTSGTTIQIPVPNAVQNDLLICIITSDTYDATGGFTTNATSQGWTLIHQTVNTSLQSMYWKLASASEPESYTFTSTDTETYNGCILSIEDINTTNPFGNPAVRTTSNPTVAAKFAMPQITTNVANSLILYVFSGSSTGIPSMLEGPVVSLLAADGTAECTSVGWGFKPTTGLTASNVTCSIVTTGAGVATTLQIAPPSGGAQIIPGYPTADASIYVDPLNGTSAFNGNTAPAATADTNFGTSLGGLTAGDATLAATADVGINSFHSVARATSLSASRNLSGFELVLAAANRPNVTNKNIICHVGPSTEGQLQRMSSITSGRGIWFGMRSNTGSGGATTGYKIWQVYGVEKGSLRHQPIIINSGAINTKATSGTLDPAVIASFGFWVAGGGVSTTVWDFASLWVLDTTTVCGGNAANPLNIPKIEMAVAIGKERKSFIRQGSAQAIIYQPIQIGNGGTDPVYLDLNSSAIEFPRQYNEASLDVQYNSIDNAAGITYYAGASDTIKHRNSSISSSSKYHWGFHASSSGSATYDFSGLSIIGAGTVNLRAAVPLTSVTFNNCSPITHVSNVLTDCEFIAQSGTSTDGALVVTATSAAALTTALATINDCYFTNNITALKLVYTGTAGAVSIDMSTIYFSGNTTDIYWSAPSGSNLTINLTEGANPTTWAATNSNTVTFSQSNAFTIENIVYNSEVGVFLADGTLIASVENIGISSPTGGSVTGPDTATGRYSFAHTHAYSNQSIYIVVICNSDLGSPEKSYQVLRQDYVLKNETQNLPITQLLDRNYSNPS